MDYTIRDTPDSLMNFSNEDYKKLVKAKPTTLEQALAQREILIDKIENLLVIKDSLSADLSKSNARLYGYSDWFTEEVDGALDLLEEVVNKKIETCVGKCVEKTYNPHSTIECLESRIKAFLEELDE